VVVSTAASNDERILLVQKIEFILVCRYVNKGFFLIRCGTLLKVKNARCHMTWMEHRTVCDVTGRWQLILKIVRYLKEFQMLELDRGLVMVIVPVRVTIEVKVTVVVGSDSDVLLLLLINYVQNYIVDPSTSLVCAQQSS
jgi:hypothetical protein